MSVLTAGFVMNCLLNFTNFQKIAQIFTIQSAAVVKTTPMVTSFERFTLVMAKQVHGILTSAANGNKCGQWSLVSATMVVNRDNNIRIDFLHPKLQK
jgi:hypothetical protein